MTEPTKFTGQPCILCDTPVTWEADDGSFYRALIANLPFMYPCNHFLPMRVAFADEYDRLRRREQRNWRSAHIADPTQPEDNPPSRERNPGKSYVSLDFNFLREMALNMGVGKERYGLKNYTTYKTDDELATFINHAMEHLRGFMDGQLHEAVETVGVGEAGDVEGVGFFNEEQPQASAYRHLAAIACNAMMLAWHVHHDWPKVEAWRRRMSKEKADD